MISPFTSPTDEVREFLAELIERLNELDEIDYFGREGWERMLMGDFDGDY